jgi:hypothetical protein
LEVFNIGGYGTHNNKDKSSRVSIVIEDPL